MDQKQTLQIFAEQGKDGHYWGLIENCGHFMPVGQGETLEAMIQNVKGAIEDYQEHEGKEDEFWNNVDLKNVEWRLTYE